MSEDDVPVLVFSGTYEDALFLKTLIESRLFVRRSDAAHASELVADFQKRGRRSDFSNL